MLVSQQKTLASHRISPFYYFIFFIILYSFAMLDNGIGWLTEYPKPNGIWLILIFYFIFFTIGFTIPYKVKKRFKKVNNFEELLYNKYSIILIIFSIFTFVISFVKIGAIPLLSSDKIIRSTGLENVGGYVIYQTYILTLFSFLYSFFYFKYKKYKFLFFTIIPISFTLNMLMLNRAEMVKILFAVFIAKLIVDKNSKNFLLKSFFLSFILFFIIGFFGYFRYKSAMPTNMEVWEIIFWVFQGSIAGTVNFSEYIYERFTGEYLNGAYTLGMYLSIFIPKFGATGADMLRDIYLPNRITAQSISAPFSYFIDFGYSGLIIYGILIGYITKVLYKLSKFNLVFLAIYSIYFFELLFTSYGGTIPISPRFIYMLLILYFINVLLHYDKNNFIHLFTIMLFLIIVTVVIFMIFARSMI